MTNETINFDLISGTLTLQLEVTGKMYDAIRGSRDKWGAPEEPDEDAHFEIEMIKVDGVEVEDFDQFLEDLDMSWERFEEICFEKVEEAWNDYDGF